MDYTQAELDRAYDQRVWAPNADEVIARYATASAEVRAACAARPTSAMARRADEVLDWFPAAAPAAPVLVFVHGGAWRGGRKEQYSFPAEPLVAAGAHYVALDFASIPQRAPPRDGRPGPARASPGCRRTPGASAPIPGASTWRATARARTWRPSRRARRPRSAPSERRCA